MDTGNALAVVQDRKFSQTLHIKLVRMKRMKIGGGAGPKVFTNIAHKAGKNEA